MMAPLNRPSTSFDVDRYLDGKPQPEPLSVRFRGWAVRINDRIERIDLKTLALWFEKLVMSVVLSGVAIYLAFSVADALVQGRFNLGGR